MDTILIINDHDKILEVYKKSDEYLKAHIDLKKEISNHLWAYQQIDVVVPQTLEIFGSGHFFPFSESYYELENSFELCMLGFYRYSFFALRSVLELAVVGLFYDKDNQSNIDIQKWIRSKEATPHFQSILKSLFELNYFKLFNSEFGLFNEIKDLYALLCDYVHTRGYFYSTSGQSISNFNQFNEKAFLKYSDIMQKTVNKCIIMMLLKYPIGMQDLPVWDKFGFNIPIGGFPEEYYRDAYLKVINENMKDYLQKISDKDPNVQSIVEYVNNIPDLSEEEIQQQINEEDDWFKRLKNPDNKD